MKSAGPAPIVLPAAPLLLLPLLLIILTASMAVVGCGGGTGDDGGQAAGAGKLRMVGNENMAFLEVGEGGFTGFSADLAAAIAERMGRTLEVRIAPFADLFTEVQTGEADIAMSAITITPERLTEVGFSDSYFSSGQALLVPKDSRVTGPSDLRGATVGVLDGSTNEQEAEGIPGIARIMPFLAKEPMFDALAAGALDAVVCDTPFALYHASTTGKTRVAEVLTEGDEYGIAVEKGNAGLLAEIDEALASLRQDGTYDRLYEEYFGK